MILKAPEAEALYEGYAQKGFKVLGLVLDGSPAPLGSTALPRSLSGHIAREVEWGSPDGPRDQNPWIKKRSNAKTKENQ
ncbi:MAG: hypothetical protein RQ885_00965 [Desulfurococcales archaeon]|jgi:hypothetical protein|nr:hypothetical protein [Desulfurococcales archaeon]